MVGAENFGHTATYCFVCECKNLAKGSATCIGWGGSEIYLQLQLFGLGLSRVVFASAMVPVNGPSINEITEWRLSMGWDALTARNGADGFSNRGRREQLL